MRRCCYRHYLYGLALLLGGVLLTTPLPAEAGGTVTGRVTYVGKVPPAKEFVFKKFPNTDFCKTNPKRSADGTIRLLREVEVMKGGGLKHAIVSLRDVTDTEWTNTYQRTEVVAEKCEWLPFTGVVVNKAGFYVENHDADPSDPKSKKGVLHNPHGFEVLGARSSTLFNVGLPTQGGSVEKKLILRKEKRGSVMRLLCDQHEFVQAWFLPVTNPYFARVNEEDGTFEILNVPPGKHKLLAWHLVAGRQEIEVTVVEGQTAEANFNIIGKR